MAAYEEQISSQKATHKKLSVLEIIEVDSKTIQLLFKVDISSGLKSGKINIAG